MMTLKSMKTASAADIARHFGHWRTIGAREPIFVTSHGRVTHVLMGIDRFTAFSQNAEAYGAPFGPDGTNWSHLADDSVVTLRALTEWIAQGFILCDAKACILASNRLVQSLCGRSAPISEGEDLWSALPELRGTFAEIHIRRTMLGGEPSALNVPSPFRKGAILHVQAIPLGLHTAILLKDISAQSQAQSLSNAGLALMQAIEAHPSVAFLIVSPRGMIERTSTIFTRMIGVPEDRLIKALALDLVTKPARMRFREALESALLAGEAQQCNVAFPTNSGATISGTLAITPIASATGPVGAALLFTETNVNHAQEAK